MPPVLQSQLLPETNPQILEQFAIRGPLAVRAVLDNLVRERPMVSMYASDDFSEFVVSQVFGWDDAGVRLDFVTDAARRRALFAADHVIVVAFLERIKIQFDALGLALDESVSPPVLRCALPTVVHRIQRRESYRVRPPTRIHAECAVRVAPGDERIYRVTDISAGGLGLVLPPGEAPPAGGDVWHHCRLEFPGYPPVPCALVVRVVAEGLRGDVDGTRVGFEFVGLTSEAQRTVQLYVMDVERARAGVGR